MEALIPYLPYLITAALSWALSSRSSIWLPWLDPPNPAMPVPRTGRPALDLALTVVWRLLPDDRARGLLAEEAALIAKALDAYNVKPLFSKDPPA